MEYQYSLYDMDNLAAERAIRPFTVHRKNAVSFESNTNYEDARTMSNQAGIIIRNVKNELFHSAKRLILNEVKGIECLHMPRIMWSACGSFCSTTLQRTSLSLLACSTQCVSLPLSHSNMLASNCAGKAKASTRRVST